MDETIRLLYKTIMRYYSDLAFIMSAHVPQCKAWVDRILPDFYSLNFSAAGRLRWMNTAGDFTFLDAPLVWWMWPGHRFVFGAAAGESWDHYYVGFRGPRADRIFTEGLASRRTGACWMTPNDPVLFRKHFEELIKTIKSEATVGKSINLLEALFLQTHDRTGNSLSLESRLGALAQRMRSDVQEEWGFETEAQRLGLSMVHFRRCFKRHTGTSPHRFLVQAKLEYASKLLNQTSLPLKKVAQMTGYEDIYHFTKAFKSFAGQPPGKYRSQMHNTQTKNGGRTLTPSQFRKKVLQKDSS